MRALTAASRRFLADPPPGFADAPLLSPRGVVTVALPGDDAEFEAALAAARTAPGGALEIAEADARALVPILRAGRYARAMHKPARWTSTWPRCTRPTCAGSGPRAGC